MNITRNNYQEFFMLFVDNELLPTEKEIVLQFAKTHPDLEEELQLLMDCKLDSTTISFTDKSKLFKPTIWNEEESDPVRIKMLELLDNELNQADAAALKEKIQEEELLQYEWQILQKAHLPTEEIIYPDKQLLYKKDEIKRIVWLRWAAAAAILILVGLFWPRMDSKKDEKQSSVAQIKSLKKANQNNSAEKNNISKNANISSLASNDKAYTDSYKSYNKNNEEKERVTTNKKENNVQEFVYPSNVQEDEKETLAKTNSAIELKRTDMVKETLAPTQLKAIPANYKMANDNHSVSAALYNGINDEISDEEFMRIGLVKISKQKARSLFRGISRKLTRPFKNKIESEREVSTMQL